MKKSVKQFIDLTINSDDHTHNLEHIEKAFQTNPNETLNIIDKLISDDPWNPILWTYKGFAFSLFEKKNDAINCFTKALDINSECDLALYLISLDLFEVGSFQEALKYLDILIEKKPHFKIDIYSPTFIRRLIISEILKEKGEHDIEYSDSYLHIYGSIEFSGKVGESENGMYLIAVDNIKKIYFLLFENEIKLSVDFGEPISFDSDYDSQYDIDRIYKYGVSNNGNFFVNNRHSFSAYDNEGNLLIQNEFESYLSLIHISNDGNYVACANSDTLFFFDLREKKLAWKHKLNPSNPIELQVDLENETVFVIYDKNRYQKSNIVEDKVRYGYSFKGDFLDAARLENDKYSFLSNYSKFNLAEKKIKELGFSNSNISLYDELLDLLNSIDDVSINTQAKIQRYIGEIYCKKGDYTLAIGSFEKALSLNPKVGVKTMISNLKQRVNGSCHQPLIKNTKKSKSTQKHKSSCIIQSLSNENLLKLTKEIQTTKKIDFVTTFDDHLVYQDGSIRPYNLIKMNEAFETEWKIPYNENIRNICFFDKTFLVETTKWNNENIPSTAQTTLCFININGIPLCEFIFDCYTRLFSNSNSFAVTWSSDSKIRLFNAEGELLWQHSVTVEDIYELNSISVSNNGLVVYSLKNHIWMIDSKQNRSLVYQLSSDNHKKLTGDDLNYNNIESEIDELGTEKISVEIRGESHIISCSKIHPDSNKLFFGLNSFKFVSNHSYDTYKVYCINLNKDLVWKCEVDSYTRTMYLDTKKGNLHVFCCEAEYIINEGKIVTENESRVTKYFNQKKLYFIVSNDEVSVLDKDMKALAKLIFSSTVNYLEVLEKHNKLVVATDKRLLIFDILHN